MKAVPHQIELDKMDSWPVHSAHMKQVPKARELEKQEVDRMLATDGTEPAQAEYALQIAFVAKKDRALCFCSDYQKLNAVKIWDS